MDMFINFLAAAIAFGTPILYGIVGEIMNERVGHLNLGVEGMMSFGAFLGFMCGYTSESFALAVLGAFAGGMLMSFIYVLLTVTFMANQNVAGLTLTVFGIGLSNFLGQIARSKTADGTLRLSEAFKSQMDVHFGALENIPVIGKLLFSYNWLVYLGVIVALLMSFYLKKTKTGLNVCAIGENPAAADSLGVNIALYKFVHIMLGAGIMGIGGYYMGLNMSGSLSSNCWINGYGWISVALVIFSNWNPLAAILGTFVFGFFNTLRISGGSLANTFPGTLGWLGNVPAQFLQMLPFVITAIVLIAYSVRKNKHTNAPAAIGVNYYREDR